MFLFGALALEEEVLFPAYEALPGAPQGPTTALREEHSGINRLIRDASQVVGTRDSDHELDCLSHLEYRMIQHHEKEEDIFLPLASYILNSRREELLRKLERFDAAKLQQRWDI